MVSHGLMLGWVLGLAGAQEPGASEVATPPAPPVRSVGFVGRPGGTCETTASGVEPACVDVVDFYDPAALARPGSERIPAEVRASLAAGRAAGRDVSALYLRAFEDLANHWRQADVAGTLGAQGFTALPAVLPTWGRLPRGEKAIAAGPSLSTLLGDRTWRVSRAAPDAPRTPGAMFGRVRYQLSDDAWSPAAPDTVLLSGRFALRLGASGESHDFDVMDADAQSSEPFFEQMYPYRATTSGLGLVYAARDRVPLQAFRSGRGPLLPCLGIDGDGEQAAAGCVADRFDPVAAAAAGSRSAPDESGARALAKAHFDRFHRVVFVQTAQYAMEEYTTNHMRVLTALTAMANPLLGDSEARRLSRDLVAAARGETDRASERLEGKGDRRGPDRAGDRVVRLDVLPLAFVRPWLDRLLAEEPATRDLLRATSDAVIAAWPEPPTGPLRAGRLAGLDEASIAAWYATIAHPTRTLDEATTDVAQEALRLRLLAGEGRALVQLSVLPQPVLRRWVGRLLEVGAPEGFAPALDAAVGDRLATSLRPGPRQPLPRDLTDEVALEAWFDGWLLPGTARDDARTRVLRAALWLLLRPQDDGFRAREESWLLGEHVRYEIARTFDETALATPSEVVDEATSRWQETLGRHGYAPRPFPQGSGAIDPVSVCTTKDALDALDEPSFQLIEVDQLVRAPRGLSGAAVIEAAGDAMPWRYVDDPTQPPRTTRLVDLGDGQSLYRVRWTLWSGWHVLWTTTDAPDGRRELVARTTALCDDMVLTHADLVPTVIRAGLLHANLRPTVPQTAPEAAPPNPDDAVSGDDVAEKLEEAPGLVEEGLAKVDEAKAFLQEPPTAEDLAGQEGSFGDQVVEIQQEELDETTTYFRSLVWDRLLARHGSHGVLVFVFDATAPTKAKTISNILPRTPYRRFQQPIGGRFVDGDPKEVLEDGHVVRTAGWMWYAHPDGERPMQLSPGYTARTSVLAGEAVPRWTQRRTVDFSLGIDANAVPLLHIRFECDPDVVTGPNFGGTCTGDETLDAQGFGFSLQGLATMWVHDHPRMGVDLGIGADLLVRPAGAPLYSIPTDGSRLVSPGWGLRFQAGILAGLRWAPVPPHLSGPRRRSSVWSTTRNSGGERIGRIEWGIRTGAMIGPGFNGVEATIVGELWSGFSTGPKRGRRATFRPYHPGILVGPFARVVYGLPAGGGGPARALRLQDSWTAIVGLRTQLRLQKATKVPKEVP